MMVLISILVEGKIIACKIYVSLARELEHKHGIVQEKTTVDQGYQIRLGLREEPASLRRDEMIKATRTRVSAELCCVVLT